MQDPRWADIAFGVLRVWVCGWEEHGLCLKQIQGIPLAPRQLVQLLWVGLGVGWEEPDAPAIGPPLLGQSVKNNRQGQAEWSDMFGEVEGRFPQVDKSQVHSASEN